MLDDKDSVFPINRYLGPEFFCDREEESNKLMEALTNGRNTVVMAPRRFGKTGLIHHTFHRIKAKRKNVITVFLDIYSAKDLSDFNSQFLSAVSEALAEDSSKIWETVSSFFKSLRPVVSFDPFTGVPEVSLSAETPQKVEKDLGEILRILDAQKKPVYVAIDEFQQIESFPENADAILRTHIQQCKNISFIFSGSQKHLLLPIFSDAKRPFYASTDFLHLQKIDVDEYATYIHNQFAKRKKSIEEEDVRYILNWCRVHTYYVQVICNKIDSIGAKKINHQHVIDVMTGTIKEQDALMSSIKAMLPVNQWELFRAICMEDQISSYTSRDFIQKHKLPSSAAVVQSMKALEEKEMIYMSGIDPKTERAIYEPYNVFFAKWVKHRKAVSGL